MTSSEIQGVENMTNPNFLSVSTLKGHNVVNKAKEDLGKIEDLMIDFKNDRIAYAVLSFGGFLGVGNKLFAVPWKAIEHRFSSAVYVPPKNPQFFIKT